jgi:ABC-type uncharacterized transport system auxiliary subunit
MDRLSLFLSVLLPLALCGCGAPRPIRYYAVQIPAAPAPGTATYAIDLAVGRITGPSLLEAAPIVYRTGASQMGTYQYQRWEEAPVDMVQTKLIRLLRCSGNYLSVSSLRSAPDGQFVVKGRLYKFEEVDGEGITGHVTMEFDLFNRKTGKVVWSHYYSQVEPAQGKEITGVVQALDRNLERGLTEVVAGLSRYFAANPPQKS